MKKTVRIKTVQQGSKEIFDDCVNELLSKGYEIHSTGYEEGKFIAIMEYREELKYKTGSAIEFLENEGFKVVPAKSFECGNAIQELIDEGEIVIPFGKDHFDGLGFTKEEVNESLDVPNRDGLLSSFFGVDFGNFGNVQSGDDKVQRLNEDVCDRIDKLYHSIHEDAQRAGVDFNGIEFTSLIIKFIKAGYDFEQISEKFKSCFQVVTSKLYGAGFMSDEIASLSLNSFLTEIAPISPIGKIGDVAKVHLSEKQKKAFSYFFDKSIEPIKPEQNNDELFVGPASEKIGAYKQAEETAYQSLFSYLSSVHNLILTDTELSDIISKVIPVIIEKESFARSFCWELEKRKITAYSFVKFAEGEEKGKFDFLLDIRKKRIQEDIKAGDRVKALKFLQYNETIIEEGEIFIVEKNQHNYLYFEGLTGMFPSYCFEPVNYEGAEYLQAVSNAICLDTFNDNVIKKGKILKVALINEPSNTVDFVGIKGNYRLSNFTPVDEVHFSQIDIKEEE